MTTDILFNSNDFIFSYRVAGILIRDNKILLQKPKNDNGYSIPGGHVSFGEISSETLVREFKEEINADIKIEKLIMVGENFFPWGNKSCQQISMYYAVSLLNESQIQLEGTFQAFDVLGNQRIDLDFSWIPLSELNNIKVYPANIKEDLISLPEQIKYFFYKQEPHMNDNNMIQLSSQRLLLRNFKETDLDILYHYRNDTICSKYQQWENTSKEHLRDFIQLHQNRTLKDGDIQLAIASNDNNELIGDLYIAIKGKTITLGYTISPNHQRKGYAYEVLSSLIPLLLNQYNEFEIVCLVHPDNTPSIKLLEKLNFTNEGYEPQLDSLIFSITSTSKAI